MPGCEGEGEGDGEAQAAVAPGVGQRQRPADVLGAAVWLPRWKLTVTREPVVAGPGGALVTAGSRESGG